MSLKDILTLILSVEADEAAIVAAETIAETMAAHVTALLLEPEPDPVYTLEGVMVSAMWSDVLARSRRDFAAEKEKLEQRLLRGARPTAVRELAAPLGVVAREASMTARYAELIVMRRPGDDDIRLRLFERILFGSGRPILLAPRDWRKGSLGRRIAIAWNGKREAARAVADAAPFLRRADHITVITLAADKHRRAREEADALVAHLERCGLSARARVAEDLGFSESATLLAEAGVDDADLVVMGGYGRSRLGEFVFGGLTREMLNTCELPVLMSH